MSGNFILRAAAGTDAGRKHNVNQDNAFAYVRDPELGKSRGLFIVADGMGGHKAGEIASQLAVETIHQELVWFLMQSDEEDTQPSYPAIGQEGTSETEQNLLEKRLLLAIQQANRRITQYAESNPIDAGNLGTTITCALIDENQAIIVNIGDSRTYLLRGGKLYQITEDHSYVGHLVREGQLAPEGIYDHPRRNVITRSLGYRSNVEADLFPRAIEVRDRLLLCSDGLWEMIRDEGIKDVLMQEADPQRASDLLVRHANAAGGDDNISVIVVQVETITETEE